MWNVTSIRKLSKIAGVPKNIKFEDLPGPRSLPIIGSLPNYLPIIGSYSLNRIHWAGKKKLDKFGPLVREEISPGVFSLFIFKPEDYETLFRLEGPYPERRSHLAVAKYRLDRPNIYSSPGLLPTNGPEWWRIRQAAQKSLSKTKNVRRYLPVMNETVQEFMNQIPHKIFDFLPLLSLLFLELTSLVTFDQRISSFDFHDNINTRHTRAEKLIKAAFDINSCIISTDHGLQLWKQYDTPIYRKLKRGHQVLESVALDFISKKKEMLLKKEEGTESTSILEEWLTEKDLSERDITGLSTDMLLAGVDTTTYSTSMFLYHLATNENSQEKLAKEAKELLPSIHSNLLSLDHAPYTKAALKESLRLNPIAVGVGRTLPEDTTLSGCVIPKKTIIITQNQVSCRLPEYFDEPNRFLPERWLKDNPSYRHHHPFLSLPFGHGRRGCIARRFAEQNMLVFIIHLLRRYKIQWAGKSKLDVTSLLINKPDSPISIILTPRKD